MTNKEECIEHLKEVDGGQTAIELERKKKARSVKKNPR